MNCTHSDTVLKAQSHVTIRTGDHFRNFKQYNFNYMFMLPLPYINIYMRIYDLDLDINIEIT